MLTRVVSGSLIQGAVTIIISGDKPDVDEFKKETERITFLDGRFSDIGMNIPNDIMTLISMSWNLRKEILMFVLSVKSYLKPFIMRKKV